MSVHISRPWVTRYVQCFKHMLDPLLGKRDSLTFNLDIILSPFKPQGKNVTGVDVSNSLYYIHLDTTGDDLLVPKAQRQQEATPRASLESARRIARKPLPATAQVPQPQAQSPTDTLVNPEEHVKFPPLSQPTQNKENVPLGGQLGARDPLANPAGDMPAPPVPAKLHHQPVPILRKPLGPRKMSTDTSCSPPKDLPAQPSEAATRPAAPPTPEEHRPPLPARPQPPPLRFDNQPPRTFDEFRATQTPIVQSPVTPSRSPSPWGKINQKPFTPFSLTIIRRDPSTSHQWNIGKVTSYQSTLLYQDPNNPDAEPVVQYPRGYPAINVHIETSGYARFRHLPLSLPAEGGGAAQSMKELAAQIQREQQQQAAAAESAEDGEGGFNRQVVMTYGKTWTHNLKEAFRGTANRDRSYSNTTQDNEPLQPPRRVIHRRQDSGTSTNSNDSASYFPDPTLQVHHNMPAGPHADHPNTAGDDQPVIPTQPAPGLRPKGYTFTSPWGGTCDFRTSSNGRALKCRHTRNTTSQGFNPLVAAQALLDSGRPSLDSSRPAAGTSGTGGGGGGGRRSRGVSASMGVVADKVGVSELRFNLPSTDLFHSKEDRERAAREVVEGFGRMLVRSPGAAPFSQRGHSEGEEEEDMIFDYSGLGKERAGGGNRGKRAKLGKLLVHDEGLKMLDLVVAANMGIWWQAWERSF